MGLKAVLGHTMTLSSRMLDE